IVPDGNAQPKPHVKLSAPIGLVYLVLSLGINAWYLYLLLPYTKNDLWWPGFNTTGIQTFLADAINTHLACQHFGAIDLRSLGVVQKTYYDRVTAPPQIDFRFPQARRAVFGNLTFESVVLAMRNSSMTDNLGMGQPYCWVDLHRTFELAHTAARQRRCVKWAANAAMYLETLLRNAMPSDGSVIRDENVGTSVLWSKVLNATVYSPLATLPGGTEWVAAIRSHEVVSVVDEVAAWTSYGLTYWSTQVKNIRQASFDDSIVVVNAIGVTQRFTISRNPLEGTHALNQDTGTSALFFTGFVEDINMCLRRKYKCSVVRGADRFVDAVGLDWDQLYYDQSTPGANIVRSFLGPLGAIDVQAMDIPPPLSAVFLAFQSILGTLGDNDAYNALANSDVIMEPVPQLWRNRSFFSGSLLCPDGLAQSFPQGPFSWADDCSTQKPLQITLGQNSALFAMTASSLSVQDIPSACALSPSTSRLCVDHLSAIANLTEVLSRTLSLQQLLGQIPTVVAALRPLNISFLQLAESDEMLVQPLLDMSSPAWSFFGWLTIYEWLQAKREVYWFEGDVGVITLMSDVQPYYPIDANPIELPRVACDYVAFVNVYVGGVLLAVGALVAISSLVSLSTVEATHLFFFNRVAGAVYIGRPLLVLRGLTAVVLLSAASTSFQDNSGFARLVHAPRTFLDIAVLAGEATWLTYAMQDFFLPVTQPYTNVYGPLNTLVVWAAMVGITCTVPFETTVTLDRTCSPLRLGQSVTCTNGVVRVGSLARFSLICIVQVVSMAASFLIVRCLALCFRRPFAAPPQHVVLPATAHAFFLQTSPGSPVLNFDAPSSILCGLLPMPRGWYLDIKRWVFEQYAPRRPRSAKCHQQDSNAHVHENIHPNIHWLQWLGFGGLCYVLTSCIGSYVFLSRIKTTLVNDLWWPRFNATGHQTFIANFFVTYLQFGASRPNLKLDSPTYADTTSYGDATSYIRAPWLYPSSVQDEANSLANVVLGLRSMDSCLLPWISTAYCFVDFDRSWEMANSETRQQRCQVTRSNGAVYLEATLRNTDWASLTSWCWGHGALDSAVFSFLRQSNQGVAWLAATRTAATSVEAEVDVWRQHGIDSYGTQWQNYKSLGVTEHISIQNAFGVAYPFTIRNSMGVMKVETQTTFKMYWGLANDLLAVAANATSLGGRSLVRESPSFAFGGPNGTMLETVLVENATLMSPLGAGLSLVRNMLGPFGTVDMVRVNCPSELQDLYRQLNEAMMTLVNSSPAIEQAYLNLPDPFQGIVPPINFFPTVWIDAWNNNNFRGGDLLCDATTEDLGSPGSSISSAGSCSAESSWYLSPPPITLKAILAANLTTLRDSTPICDLDTMPLCDTKIMAAVAFLTNYSDASTVRAFASQGRAVASVIRDTVQLEYMQFLDTPDDFSDVSVSRIRFFDPTEPDVAFFLWGHVFEWVEGRREVVRFTGDAGSIAVLSKYQWDASNQVANPTEIPRNFSTFTYLAAAYITIVLFSLALAACLYILLARGYVEGTNMLQFNRVVGGVWIGRPLMLLRGCIALALLSTATLDLTKSAGIHGPEVSDAALKNPFDAPATRMFTTLPEVMGTLLSASEVNWVVYLVNDLFSVVTADYTYWGSALSAVAAWALTAIWSFVLPVKHSVTVARECHVDAVDWHATCTSGVVEIGRVSRFTGLLGLAVGISFVTYIVLRVRWWGGRAMARQTRYESRVLSSVATFSFSLDHWTHDDADGRLYLDKASALLNGMITAEWQGKTFIFDIKTWRGYVKDTSRNVAAMDHCPNCRRFYHAIPMTE
ncbi:hypothetical protein As57867_003190, partial [Aphanomyces stellatus]